jgi:hypothetical protein
MQFPSTKTFVLGRSTVMLLSRTFVPLVLFLVETVPFKSDAVQKIHQNFVSVLGQSSIIGLNEDHKITIN